MAQQPAVTGADLGRVYTSGQLFRPGQHYFDESGNEYIFIRYDQGSGAVAGTAGLFVCKTDSTHPTWTCTADLNDADALPMCPVGQLMATLADGEYGFVQCKGRNRVAITTDGTITAGCIAKLSAGDGTITIWNTGVAVPVGVSGVTDTVNAIAIGEFEIFCPF